MGELQSPIIGGHVYCRQRRDDVDVSACITCERMRALHDRTAPPYLVCEVDALELGEPDPGFVAWWYQHHRHGR